MRDAIAPSRADGALVLADISGYTAFLRSVAEAHRDDAFADGRIPDAYGLVSTLLSGIVDRLVPPFTLSKIEGDAVFVFADDVAAVPTGPALVEFLGGCHADFRRRLADAHEVWTCSCDACSRIDVLELKFVVHAGAFVIGSIAGSVELIGPEVVLAHRLLKSGAADVVGTGAYAVVTDAAATRLAVPTDAAATLVESVEHYAPTRLHAFRFDAR
jgi:hypothetical protein